MYFVEIEPKLGLSMSALVIILLIWSRYTGPWWVAAAFGTVKDIWYSKDWTGWVHLSLMYQLLGCILCSQWKVSIRCFRFLFYRWIKRVLFYLLTYLFTCRSPVTYSSWFLMAIFCSHRKDILHANISLVFLSQFGWFLIMFMLRCVFLSFCVFCKFVQKRFWRWLQWNSLDLTPAWWLGNWTANYLSVFFVKLSFSYVIDDNKNAVCVLKSLVFLCFYVVVIWL